MPTTFSKFPAANWSGRAGDEPSPDDYHVATPVPSGSGHIFLVHDEGGGRLLSTHLPIPGVPPEPFTEGASAMKTLIVRAFDRMPRGPWLRLAAALIMTFGVVPDRVVASFGHDEDDLSGLVAMARAMGIDDELEPEERAALARHVETVVQEIGMQQSIVFDRQGDVTRRNESLSVNLQVFVDEEAIAPIVLIGHLIMEAETDGGEKLQAHDAEIAVRNLKEQLETRQFLRMFHPGLGRHRAFEGLHQEDQPRFHHRIALTAPSRRASRFERFRGVLLLAVSDEDLVELDLGTIEEIDGAAINVPGHEHIGEIQVARSEEGALELSYPSDLAVHIATVTMRSPNGATIPVRSFSTKLHEGQVTWQMRGEVADGSTIHLKLLPDIKFLLVPFSFDHWPMPGPNPVARGDDPPADQRLAADEGPPPGGRLEGRKATQIPPPRRCAG